MKRFASMAEVLGVIYSLGLGETVSVAGRAARVVRTRDGDRTVRFLDVAPSGNWYKASPDGDKYVPSMGKRRGYARS